MGLVVCLITVIIQDVSGKESVENGINDRRSEWYKIRMKKSPSPSSREEETKEITR